MNKTALIYTPQVAVVSRSAIEQQRGYLYDEHTLDDLIALGRMLQDRAEPGFYEIETHRILSERFRDLGFSVREFEGMPGFIAGTGGTAEKRSIALLADMDALPGGEGGSYRHSCGHHLQMTVLFGAARSLMRSAPELISRVAFIATPAEEYVDFHRRETLRQQGRIRHFSGKQELIERGTFEPFRWIVATHAASLQSPRMVSSVLRMNGFEVLHFRFQGVSAHAGAHPHLGKNAQNAASLFLQACAFLREEFPEDRHIRIHPVLRLKPEQAVSFVPDLAVVESYVRAADPQTVGDVVEKLCAAAEGCARAIGLEVETERIPGYAPFAADPVLHDLVRATAGEEGWEFFEEDFSAASTDVGDVSQIKPSIIVGLPGTNGRFHNPEFRITDEQAAYVHASQFLSRFLQRIAELPQSDSGP
jgi:amidohydrolase